MKFQQRVKVNVSFFDGAEGVVVGRRVSTKRDEASDRLVYDYKVVVFGDSDEYNVYEWFPDYLVEAIDYGALEATL